MKLLEYKLDHDLSILDDQYDFCDLFVFQHNGKKWALIDQYDPSCDFEEEIPDRVYVCEIAENDSINDFDQNILDQASLSNDQILFFWRSECLPLKIQDSDSK